MSDTAMDELFGMMKIAKTQQEAVQTALDGLAAERAALAKERANLAATLAQQAEAVKTAAGGVSNVAASIRQAASDAIPAIQKAAGEAGKPASPVPQGIDGLSWVSGWIEGDAKRQQGSKA